VINVYSTLLLGGEEMNKRFWLIQKRMEAGYTQKAFAAKLGMHVNQYNAYENGRVSPQVDQQLRIANALGFDVSLWYENEK